MLIGTRNSDSTLTKAPIGAREPWSTMVPAQSKTTAFTFMSDLTRVGTLARTAVELRDDLLADGERGRGAGAAGDDDNAHAVGRAVDQHQAVARRRIGSGPAFGDGAPGQVEHG